MRVSYWLRSDGLECHHSDKPHLEQDGERCAAAMRFSVKSCLAGDELVLRPIELTAVQATRLRRRASRNGWTMPMSQYEQDLYAAAGLEPPTC